MEITLICRKNCKRHILLNNEVTACLSYRMQVYRVIFSLPCSSWETSVAFSAFTLASVRDSASRRCLGNCQRLARVTTHLRYNKLQQYVPIITLFLHGCCFTLLPHFFLPLFFLSLMQPWQLLNYTFR